MRTTACATLLVLTLLGEVGAQDLPGGEPVADVESPPAGSASPDDDARSDDDAQAAPVGESAAEADGSSADDVELEPRPPSLGELRFDGFIRTYCDLTVSMPAPLTSRRAEYPGRDAVCVWFARHLEAGPRVEAENGALRPPQPIHIRACDDGSCALAERDGQRAAPDELAAFVASSTCNSAALGQASYRALGLERPGEPLVEFGVAMAYRSSLMFRALRVAEARLPAVLEQLDAHPELLQVRDPSDVSTAVWYALSQESLRGTARLAEAGVLPAERTLPALREAAAVALESLPAGDLQALAAWTTVRHIVHRDDPDMLRASVMAWLGQHGELRAGSCLPPWPLPPGEPPLRALAFALMAMTPDRFTPLDIDPSPEPEEGR